MDSNVIIILALLVLQGVNLWVMTRNNHASVQEAAKKAAESTRKNMENKLYKYNPWLKGYDPNKVVQMHEEVEDNGEYVGPGILG